MMSTEEREKLQKLADRMERHAPLSVQDALDRIARAIAHSTLAYLELRYGPPKP